MIRIDKVKFTKEIKNIIKSIDDEINYISLKSQVQLFAMNNHIVNVILCRENF